MTHLLKIFLALIFILSCSTKRPKGKTEAEVLYKEAKELMDDKRYLLATEKLNILRSQHPYSFYATSAELMQAEVLFKQENFVESAAAFLMFRDLHPKHSDMAYVLFMIAESYFKQLPSTFDRDLSSAYEAIRYYQQLLTRFPDTKYKGEATQRLQQTQDLLKSKDIYIADFYFRTEVYEAARFRYLKMLDQYLDDKDLMAESKYRVVRTSYLLKEYDKCIEYGKLFIEQVTKKYNRRTREMIDNCQSFLN